jgi:hypothetical protein
VTVLNVVRTGAEVPLWDEVLELLAKLPYGTPRLYVTSPGERLPDGARAGRPTLAELRALSAEGTVGEPAVPRDPDQALLCCAVPVGDVEVHA